MKAVAKKRFRGKYTDEALREKNRKRKDISERSQDGIFGMPTLTKEQREQIEIFSNGRKNSITLCQAQAIARAILDNHDMLERLLNF